MSGCRNREADKAGKVTREADLTCTWKATNASSYPPAADAPGHGWDKYGMSFCGFNGCSGSEDYFYVLPRKDAISGTVMAAAVNTSENDAPEALGVANAEIKISGPQSGTAVTNSDGFYDALVDPGKYRVSVGDVSGQPAIVSPVACSPGAVSGTDCIVDTGGADANASFEACPSSTENGVRTLGAVTRVSKAPPKCALSVTWKALETNNMSGLTRYGGTIGTSPSAVAAFQPYTASGYVPGNCLSGCTDMQVTVHAPTGAPVPKANVTVSMKTPVQTANGASGTTIVPQYPDGQPSSGFLCDFAKPKRCGTTLSDLTTNEMGQVQVIFWSPGVVQQATATFDATATAQNHSCSSGSCTLKVLSGEGFGDATMLPHLVYQSTALIPGDDVQALEYLSSELGGPKSEASEELKEEAFRELAVKVLAVLGQEEIAAPLEAYNSLDQYKRIISAKTNAGESLTMTIELFDALKVNILGLGDNSVLGEVLNPLSGPLAASLWDKGNLLGLGSKGMLWQLAAALAERFPDSAPPQTLNISVYEVSYCKVSSECGPGYHSATGKAKLSGIQPYLYLLLTDNGVPISKGDHGPGTVRTRVFSSSQVIPYSADIWDVTQSGLIANT